MQLAAELTGLFRRELELCRLREGELVALLADSATRRDYVAAAEAAARSLGADVFVLTVPALGWDAPTPVRSMGASVPALANPSQLLDAVRASLLHATFVLDLVSETIIHVPLRDELRRAGARVLTIVEPPDVLERMFPTAEIKTTVEAVRDRLAQGRELRVVSDSGTDVTYELSQTTPMGQYGFADVPGKWDHWPSALVSAYPVDGTTRGTVVLATGDIVLPFKRYVEAPVTLGIADGYVVSIDGGLDAELVLGYLESWDEPEVFAVSHIGFGMHPRAEWTALAFYDKDEGIGMDARCFAGNFIFSTGPNRHTGRLVEAHLDLPLRGCTAYLDGEPVSGSTSVLTQRV